MMDLIKLEDNLRLNITDIDAQHETLISLINEVHEIMLQGADRADLDRLLSQLLEHTRSHFSYEEELMSRYSYAGYEAHKSEHDRLMEHLEDLVVRYRGGDLLISFAVVLELKGWATIHIEKSDKPLGAFLNNQHGFETASA
jgi:hemerythrin-like metal-binding protein